VLRLRRISGISSARALRRTMSSPASTFRQRDLSSPTAIPTIYRVPKTGPGDERAWGQRIPLDTFAIGALTGKLKFAPLIGQTVPMRVVAAGSACWKCKQPTMSIQWLTVLADAMCPGFGTLNISLEVLDAGPGRGMEWVRRHLPAARLQSFGIGELKPRFSKTMGEAYLSNGCVHCDALQGRFFDHELFYDATPVFDIEALTRMQWRTPMSDSQQIRWPYSWPSAAVGSKRLSSPG
jgi:hypothetical protein